MADRVFCIDFGSSYTKVALRRDPGADAGLIRTDFAAVGEADFCFPSAVGVERQGNRHVAVCGPAVLSSSFAGGVHVHWKKRVFSTEPGRPPRKPPLDAFLESAELLEVAAKYGVTPTQVVHLQNLVANARALSAGPLAGAAEPDAQNRAFAAPLAYNYFCWLRDRVIEACGRLKLDGLDPATIPTRIAVPAFAHGKELEAHPGCQLLLGALAKAGWRMHPDRPVVSEPYSNALGVLTGGANVVSKSRVQLSRMFGKGPLITVLSKPADYPSYRALVVDVGAFTTDFATVTLKPEGQTVDDPDIAFVVSQHSVPLGVTDLDARMTEYLPKEKRDWLTKTALPVEWEGFRRAVYTDSKPYRTVAVGPIGGAADADAVRAGFEVYCQQLLVEAQKFCAGLEPVKLEELILTGGGNCIPTVRDALVGATRGGGREFAKVHAPGLKKGTLSTPTHPLKEDLARGGSALGGASIYHERDYY
jgi:hypothetical protein